MKTYHIRYYGLLAERRDLPEETVTSPATTPAAVYREIDTRKPLGMEMNSLRAAVNDEFVDWDHPLENNDRIAFLPPMSGG